MNHTRTYIPTYTRPHAHTHAHTRTHTRTRTHTHTQTHTHTHTHTRTHTHTHTHTHTRPARRTPMPAKWRPTSTQMAASSPNAGGHVALHGQDHLFGNSGAKPSLGGRTARRSLWSAAGVLCCAVMWCDVLWCDVMWCDVMWCDVHCFAASGVMFWVWCDPTAKRLPSSIAKANVTCSVCANS